MTKRFLPDGWTVAYVLMALGFLFLSDFAEPAIMAALFWAVLAFVNEVFANTLV